VNDPIVHGTYSYEKEKQLKGAKPATSLRVLEIPRTMPKCFLKFSKTCSPRGHSRKTPTWIDLPALRCAGPVPGTSTIHIDALTGRRTGGEQQSDGTVEESEFQH